jgi:hypothetical protein
VSTTSQTPQFATNSYVFIVLFESLTWRDAQARKTKQRAMAYMIVYPSYVEAQ